MSTRVSEGRASLIQAPDRLPLCEAFDRLYHVPRSQVWAGSGGRQRGHVHLHVKQGEAFQAGRIRRTERQSLCGRSGWYERVPEEGEETCPRCIEIGSRPSGRLSGLIVAPFDECANCGSKASENVTWNRTGGWTCASCGESDYPEAAE